MISSNMGTKPKVLEMLARDPTIPYSRVANEIGVTRERVRQIAKQNGYPQRYRIVKPKICPVCGGTFYTRNCYCSPTCRSDDMRNIIIVSCHQCGKPIERTPGKMRNQSGKYFCDRVCYGKSCSKKS